jgi:phage FluMu protein Com
MPNTYQKFATIAKYLDPPSTAAFTNAQSIQRSLDRLNGPWLRINDMQKLKMSSEKLSNPDEIRRLIKDNLVEVSNERKVGAERLYVEAQDPRNHYVTLLAITQMAEESGYPRRTTGQAFLDSIPEGLRSDPIVMQEAKRLDSIESKNFHVLRDILIDEASNPQVPAWLLMRILDVFSVMGVAEGDTEKEKFRSINRAVVAVASKALEAKGWRVATDAAGTPLKSIERSKKSKERSGEIGMLFEKIPTAATTSSRKSTRFAQTQGAGPMAQLQSQSDSLDKKIAEAQAQMAQLQTQKQQLANQIKGENERNAQIQKAQQAQQQAAPMAAPAPATAKYRVVYKNANKF